MKVKRIILVLGITVIVFAVLVAGIIKKVNYKNDSIESIRILPLFKLRKINGDEFNSSEISNGPLLMVFFHPECENCRYEINDLNPLFNNIRNLTSVLISNAPLGDIHEFVEETGLNDSDRLVILSDEELTVRKLFCIKDVPAILIYGRDLVLVKRFDGEVKSETVCRYLLNLD